MSICHVRLATCADAEALARLNADFNDSRVSPARIASRLDRSTTEISAVAEIDNRLVGFARVQVLESWCYDEPWAELAELYVVPSCRRQGVGRRIVSFCEDVVRTRDVQHMELAVGSGNAAGQGLYKAAGYEVQQRLQFRKRL